MAYTAEQFLNLIKSDVITDMQKSRILASLTAAQALIESNKGNSGLTQKANNLFGIKADKSWTGAIVTMKTTEYYNGVKTSVNAPFRAYSSWGESINDHSNFLLKNKRYSNLIGVTDYKLACKLIKDDGYATSPTYTNTLINTIQKYNLFFWDLEAIAGKSDPVPVIHGFITGNIYSLQKNMYVRNAPNGSNLAFGDLTENAKAHAIMDENGAILVKDTRVTVKEIKVLDNGAVWLRIPSGWICGRGASGAIYVL